MKMEKQTIPIVFATDEHYAAYCGVAIFSLIENAHSDYLYKIYVFYDKISPENRWKLESLSTDYAQVRCICVHDEVAGLCAASYNHLTVASAYRLVISKVLSSYDKVIYLDADIVVNDDVAKLYQIDIGDSILGAVRGYYRKEENDFFRQYIINTLKIKEDNFFNAGILLVNNRECIKKKITERCFSILSQRTDLAYYDQCALNIVCEGNVFFLPPTWNYEWTFLFPLTERTLSLHEKRAELAGGHLSIIHYDGAEKPWDMPGQILAGEFWKYARKSSFYEEILQKAQAKNIKNIFNTFMQVYEADLKPKKIAIYGAGNAGNRYVKRILEFKLGEIAVWVDCHYAAKTKTPLPVECVEKLYETAFDCVIIAIENRLTSGAVKEELIANGIAEEKIIQI